MSQESLQIGAGRVDPIVGEPDRTDELVLLGNRVLEKVLPDYPNAYVGCYSYSTHADFPLRYQPHPHYVQIFRADQLLALPRSDRPEQPHPTPTTATSSSSGVGSAASKATR